MKIIITEAQQKALDELQWLDIVPNHMMEYRFPMTPKIYQIISGNQRITTFHISDVHQINILAGLVGTKKTISSFTFMSVHTLETLYGIQTKGGVLYEIYGNLVIHSPNDIMSRPDENGIRWLDYYELLPSEMARPWNNIVKELFSNHNVNPSQLYIDFPQKGKEKTDLVKNYFIAAEKFIADNADKIKSHILDKRHYTNNWNEVLVNNIEIRDIYWSHRYMDGLYKRLEARNEIIKRIQRDQYYIQSSETKPLTPREKRIIDDFPGWKARVQRKLETMSNGKVYGPDSGLRSIDFVRERGGFVNPDEYKKQFPPYDPDQDEN
jgi:hypothetical protein